MMIRDENRNLDLRVQKTYDLLYEAFVKLLKEKHYKFIKVQELTKAARVNRATFYNHFENLSDFIIFCSREGFRRGVIQRFQRDDFPYNKNNLFLLIQSILTFISTEYSLWHYRWDEILFEKALREELYHFLSDWLVDAEKNKGQCFYRNIPALALSSSITGLAMVWCSNDCTETINELSTKITEIFYSGLQDVN